MNDNLQLPFDPDYEEEYFNAMDAYIEQHPSVINDDPLPEVKYVYRRHYKNRQKGYCAPRKTETFAQMKARQEREIDEYKRDLFEQMVTGDYYCRIQ